MTYSSNLSNFTCRIIFSSWSPTWNVLPLLFIWMTLPQPQKLNPPVCLSVPYYRLHYSPFIFLTCCALRTHNSPYTKMNLPFYLSPGVRILYPADTVMLWRPYPNISLRGNPDQIPTKLKPFYSPSVVPPPSPWTLFKFRTPLCLSPRPSAI
jgi:hypothetical protein